MTFAGTASFLLIGIFFFSDVQAIEVLGGKPVRPAPVESVTRVNSAPVGKRHAFYGGLNSLSRSIYKTTSNNSASKDLLSPFQFPLLLGYSYVLTPIDRIMIFIDYTFFPKKGADDGQSETHFILRIPYTRVFGKSDWEWKAGLALHQTRIKGEGGDITLNNGDSFADFSIPGRTTTTSLFVTELGLNYYFKPALSLQSSLLIEAPLHSQKRNLSLLVGLVYEIGIF